MMYPRLTVPTPAYLVQVLDRVEVGVQSMNLNPDLAGEKRDACLSAHLPTLLASPDGETVAKLLPAPRLRRGVVPEVPVRDQEVW